MTAVPLGEADAAAVGAMLGRAFQDDPLSVHSQPDAEVRRRAGGPRFAALVELVRRRGEVWVAEDLSAAACWRHPGDHHITPEEAVAAGLDRLGELLGADAHARLGAVFGHVRARVDAVAPPRHWYLMLLGVDPAHQGRGLGGEVLAPVLARADAEGLPCWLETFDARNVPFYLRHGFTVAEDDVEPSSGLRYRLMLREPR